MKQQLLLLEDVDDLGKSGEVVIVKAGYARNYLLPQKKGVMTDKNTLRMQEKLQEERKKQAQIDRKESDELAKKLETITLKKEVKVDPEGHMYGSVTVHDIVNLLHEEGVHLEKKAVRILKAIKEVGVHSISLKLPEEVEAQVTLKIIPEGIIEAEVDEVIVKPVEPIKPDLEPTEEALEPSKSEEKWSEKEKKEVKDATKKI